MAGQFGEGGGDVTAQFERGLVVVVDLGRQGVDVDDGALRVGVPQSGVVLHRVEADGEDDVRGGGDDIGGLVAEEPDPAEVVALQVAGDHTGRLEGLDHRQSAAGDEGADRRAGGLTGTARADQYDRVAGAAQDPGGLAYLTGGGGARGRNGQRLADGRGRALRRDVGGEDHGGGAAWLGQRAAEGVGDGLGDVVGVADLAGGLGDGRQQRGGVHGLVRALEPVRPGDRAAQGDHRVLLGGGGQQSGRQVAGAGAGGDQDHPRHPGEPADGRRHEDRVLLVPADDEFRSSVGQRVVDRVDLRAGNAEDVRHVVRLEALHDPLSGPGRLVGNAGVADCGGRWGADGCAHGHHLVVRAARGTMPRSRGW